MCLTIFIAVVGVSVAVATLLVAVHAGMQIHKMYTFDRKISSLQEAFEERIWEIREDHKELERRITMVEVSHMVNEIDQELRAETGKTQSSPAEIMKRYQERKKDES